MTFSKHIPMNSHNTEFRRGLDTLRDKYSSKLKLFIDSRVAHNCSENNNPELRHAKVVVSFSSTILHLI